MADGNILSRVHNNIVTAINEKTLLPKFILMVIDSNLFKRKPKQMAMAKLGEYTYYLMKTIHETIMSHRSLLSMKSKKFKYPTVLWIIPPSHMSFNDNDQRENLAYHIAKSALRFNEMRYIKLKHWSENDPSLAARSTNGYRYTGKDLARYWHAVDKAVEYWDSTKSQMNRRPKMKWTSKRSSKKH